jgi:hypothetical protein
MATQAEVHGEFVYWIVPIVLLVDYNNDALKEL